MHFDRQAIEQGLEPPTLPPLEDPLETPEQRQQREDKEQHEEAKKKADYAKRELEALQQIVELQRTNALYPLGRDRQYRRYWLFSSLPAVLVEDNELFLSPAVPQAPVSCEEKTDMPTLTRQEDHNTSSDKENELSGVASSDSSKVNGAKDDDCIIISDNEDAEVKVKDKALPTKVDADKVDSVEREGKAVSVEAEAQVDNMDTEDSPSSTEMEPPKLDSLPLEQVLQQQQNPKWYLLDSKDGLRKLMASLNPRGFRESSLQAVLQDFRPLLDVTIDSCPLEALCPLAEGEESKIPKPQVHTRTSAPRIVEGSTQSDSASEAIELTLRDGLLDLEERIFVGSLGAIKVSTVYSVCACVCVCV